MAQINLLKQKNTVDNSINILVVIVARLLTLFLFLVLLYFGWLYLKGMAVKKEIPKIQARISEKKKEVLSLADRKEFFIRQQQLKELENLLGSHRYISNLLPVMAKVTLKSGSYNNITLNEEGLLSLNINLPNLTEVDKFLQVFDYPQFNENFTDVRVGSISKVLKDEQNLYNINFQMRFNPKLIKSSQ